MRDTRLVWDLPVRATHWLLVISISGCYVTSRFTNKFIWHKYCGYAVLILATFRVTWGLVGTRHARFINFVAGPRRVWRYVALMRVKFNSETSAGHNPLGGWSIVAMLALMLAQAASGLFASDEIASAGPLYGWVSDPLSANFTSLHHIIFKGIVALVALHMLAIGYYCWALKIDLLTPMVTGRKPSRLVAPYHAIGSSRILLALLILITLVSALAAVVALAPTVSLSIF